MKTYFDPNTQQEFAVIPPRKATTDILAIYQFTDDTGKIVQWTAGQLEIIDCILNRSSPDDLKRVQIIAATQYGKSLAVAAGVAIRASLYPEKWAIVAGTTEKARIIMEYVIMLTLNNDILRFQLTPDTSLDRLRMKKSADRLTFRRKGEVRVYSAEAKLVTETSKSLMGFGSPNVVEDEAALVPDILQATVMRMLGGTADNFFMKIGNPFNRNHFLKSWIGEKYHRIFIDYKRALDEGRFTPEFIEEMKGEAMFNVMYDCLFPESGEMDLKGWLPLITESEIERAFVDEDQPFGEGRLGCDVAGGGRNFSVMVHRSYNLGRKIYKKDEPDTMQFTGNVLHFAGELKVKPENIFVDKVGIGKGAFDRLREQRDFIIGVGGADEPVDKSRFVNLRAEMYWRAREWLLRGGKLTRDNDWYQLSKVKYKVADSSGKLKMMSKEEMLREGTDSPDVADAFAMTFARPEIPQQYQTPIQSTTINPISLDPYAR
jgi:hypothetical protein